MSFLNAQRKLQIWACANPELTRANAIWRPLRRCKHTGFGSYSWLLTQISGSANWHPNVAIASQGDMASFPAGTTPFFLEIESAGGVPCKRFPARSMTQLTSSTCTLCRSAIPWPPIKNRGKTACRWNPACLLWNVNYLRRISSKTWAVW